MARVLSACMAARSAKRVHVVCRTAHLVRHLMSTTSSATAIDDATLSFFRDTLGAGNVISGASADAERYNVDWLGNFHGNAGAVLRPKTTDEVARVVARCNEQGVGVVPLGGNTGLVGGGVARHPGEVVLLLERMRSAVSFDEESAILVCEAGCVLQEADQYLKQFDFAMPVDLACVALRCVAPSLHCTTEL